MTSINLPPPIRAFFIAVGQGDLEGLCACFSTDALVNDQLRDFWGCSAIDDRAPAEVIGEGLTFRITDVREHYGEVIVTAEVDGDFDKTGLPQPTVVSLSSLDCSLGTAFHGGRASENMTRKFDDGHTEGATARLRFLAAPIGSAVERGYHRVLAQKKAT